MKNNTNEMARNVKQPKAEKPVETVAPTIEAEEPLTDVLPDEEEYSAIALRMIAVEYAIGINADNRARGVDDVIGDAIKFEKFLKEAE